MRNYPRLAKVAGLNLDKNAAVIEWQPDPCLMEIIRKVGGHSAATSKSSVRC